MNNSERNIINMYISAIKEIERQNNIINKAIEIYENRNSIEYKKKRFMEDKTIGYYMYEELKGVDKK